MYWSTCRTCSTIIFLISPNRSLFFWSCRAGAVVIAYTRHITSQYSLHDRKTPVSVCSLKLIKSLGNDNATNQWFDLLRKNNRVTSAGSVLVHFFWRSLPNDGVKFPYLRFWGQREPAAVNLSFFTIASKPFVPSYRMCTSPILDDISDME